MFLDKYQRFQGTWWLYLRGRTSYSNLEATINSELLAQGYSTHDVTPQKTPDFCCILTTDISVSYVAFCLSIKVKESYVAMETH
jgi:hypothetical protein